MLAGSRDRQRRLFIRMPARATAVAVYLNLDNRELSHIRPVGNVRIDSAVMYRSCPGTDATEGYGPARLNGDLANDGEAGVLEDGGAARRAWVITGMIAASAGRLSWSMSE